MTRRIQPLLRQLPGWIASPMSAPATERRDLCAACPMSVPCSETYPSRVAQRDDPPAGAARPRPSMTGGLTEPIAPRVVDPSPNDEEGRKEAESIKERIHHELKAQGVAVSFPRPPVVGPTLYEIEVLRSRGPVRQLDAAANDILHRLSSEDIEATYGNHHGHRVFHVKRTTPRTVFLAPLLLQKEAYLRERPGRFVVGQQPNGEVLVGDLADSSTPHLLIGGQAGSGKSYLLLALVSSLVHFHPPSAIRFVLVDPKRVTFQKPSFKSAVEAHLDCPLLFDAEEALPLLERLVEVMDERYKRFEKHGVEDLHGYNEVVSPEERLERKVVVVDEFQDLAADKTNVKTFHHAIQRLGAKARAAGIHLILATQYPDVKTVPSIIKTNLGGKIALRVTAQTSSRVILDEGGAESLYGKGDLLANLGHGKVRAQAPLIG